LKQSIENIRLSAYDKFSKIVTSWTEKILYNLGWILGVAKKRSPRLPFFRFVVRAPRLKVSHLIFALFCWAYSWLWSHS